MHLPITHKPVEIMESFKSQIINVSLFLLLIPNPRYLFDENSCLYYNKHKKANAYIKDTRTNTPFSGSCAAITIANEIGNQFTDINRLIELVHRLLKKNY
jgi:hypothetical protein